MNQSSPENNHKHPENTTGQENSSGQSSTGQSSSTASNSFGEGVKQSSSPTQESQEVAASSSPTINSQKQSDHFHKSAVNSRAVSPVLILVLVGVVAFIIGGGVGFWGQQSQSEDQDSTHPFLAQYSESILTKSIVVRGVVDEVTENGLIISPLNSESLSPEEAKPVEVELQPSTNIRLQDTTGEGGIEDNQPILIQKSNIRPGDEVNLSMIMTTHLQLNNRGFEEVDQDKLAEIITPSILVYRR